MGGSDGAIEFTNVLGGNGNYKYSIDNGATWQTAVLFSGLVAGEYSTLVRDENDCVSDIQAITLTEPVGVSSISNQGLIYPNPTNGIITIECPGTSEVAVLNTLGQIVKQTTITNSGSIDLTAQKEGIYLVRIKTLNQTHTNRLIINR